MEPFKNQYIKRSQKDYSLSFKLAVVKEVESGSIGNRAAMRKYGIQGHGTITEWRRKYGTFDIDNRSQCKAMQTPEQKIKELQEKLKRLEHHNQYLETRLTESEDKAAILDKLIDLAEEEYLISVRKNSFPDQSNISAKKQKNDKLPLWIGRDESAALL
ncbi:transposase [Chryseobacterium contaminans]|uniref:Transposase n=1 Tax=Chryseobacterium contaminans TaxID=1423959 RepID=A0A1M7GSG0_9FLAO|nr:transposase [Chryseobacterium contaminans]OCA79638.1 transposase [Chryseobacterium contaminans]SHM19098.1 Transposase and inactivated derivatives [Chryseobacterium contaminans]